jgi:hypothetical protein
MHCFTVFKLGCEQIKQIECSRIEFNLTQYDEQTQIVDVKLNSCIVKRCIKNSVQDKWVRLCRLPETQTRCDPTIWIFFTVPAALIQTYGHVKVLSIIMERKYIVTWHISVSILQTGRIMTHVEFKQPTCFVTCTLRLHGRVHARTHARTHNTNSIPVIHSGPRSKLRSWNQTR